MNQIEMFWQTYLQIEKEMLDIAKYIYITDENGDKQLNVYSPHIANLLVRVCVEIEAISKVLYYRLGGSKQRGDKSLMFDTDCLKLVDINYAISKKEVIITCPLFNITKDANKIFNTLKHAHKRQGTSWERAYQAVKHDRYSSLSKGTVCNLIHAIGALYLLNIYYKNIKYCIKYQDFLTFDFSLGSSIFSVNKPEEKYVIDVINNCQCQAKLQSNSSPYILKYTDASYKRILEINNKLEEDINNFIKQQPEFNKEEFFDQIKVQQDKGRVVLFPELCKYRINKKIPVNLSFEERKKLLIESEEWNSNLIKTSISKKMMKSQWKTFKKRLIILEYYMD